MNEDRLRVLQMLADKKITVEQAAAVLDELDKIREKSNSPTGNNVRVTIYQIGSEQPKTNIAIPISWARTFSSFMPGFIEEKIKEHGLSIDIKQIMEMLANGQVGKVVEITDHAKNERIVVSIEPE